MEIFDTHAGPLNWEGASNMVMILTPQALDKCKRRSAGSDFVGTATCRGEMMITPETWQKPSNCLELEEGGETQP